MPTGVFFWRKWQERQIKKNVNKKVTSEFHIQIENTKCEVDSAKDFIIMENGKKFETVQREDGRKKET